MPFSNGLGSCIRLTQSSYRDAVSETIRDLQEGGTDQEMADVWGVSASTVGNVRNRANDLSAINLLKIGKAFGPGSLDTVLALIGARAVARDAVTVDVARAGAEAASLLEKPVEKVRKHPWAPPPRPRKRSRRLRSSPSASGRARTKPPSAPTTRARSATPPRSSSTPMPMHSKKEAATPRWGTRSTTNSGCLAVDSPSSGPGRRQWTSLRMKG